MFGLGPSSISRPTITTSSSKLKTADAASAVEHLLRASDTLSITITRLGSLGVFSVLHVTSVSSAPEPRRSSSLPLRMSAIPLPGALWDMTLLPLAAPPKNGK